MAGGVHITVRDGQLHAAGTDEDEERAKPNGERIVRHEERGKPAPFLNHQLLLLAA